MHRYLHPWRQIAIGGGIATVVGLAALGAALIGLQSVSIHSQVSQPTVADAPPARVEPITDPTRLRRLAFTDLVYEGAFRLPSSNSNGDGFGFGGQATAYNPANNSLFVSTRSGRVAEVTIPDAVKSSAIAALPVADYVQPFSDPAEGRLKDIGSDGVSLSGLLVHNGRLIGTGVIYYDAGNTQSLSHFSRPLALSEKAVTGLARVWEGGKTGFVAGYMAAVPPEWQSSLGGPAITGQCCIPIVGRTSWGPSAFAFDPAAVKGTGNVAAQPLLYYSSQHPTLGPWEGSNPTYGGTIQMGGVALIRGTRTALYVGRNGLGDFCYGDGTSDQTRVGTRGDRGEKYCFDPTSTDKGQHAYPYRYQMWAYDLAELAQVRAGNRDPWSIKPYGVWPFDLPFPEPGVKVGGVSYDPVRQRVFVTQMLADRDGLAYRPLIHVFRVQ